MRWPAPKRAASARTAAEPDPRPHQARAQHCPCRNEVHEVDRSHGRDAGPDEPEGEEEEPQAETGEDAEQGAFAAGPSFTGAVHGSVSLADVANPIPAPSLPRRRPPYQFRPHLSVVSCPSATGRPSWPIATPPGSPRGRR